jgi:hypothetical protein
VSGDLFELSSMVNVLSRTVGDLEKQRQDIETRSAVLNQLVLAVLNALPAERRADALQQFASACRGLLEDATPTRRQALQREIAALQRLLAGS